MPTWNYLSVHVHGRIEFIDEPERLLSLLKTLTHAQEKAKTSPWKIGDTPKAHVQQMLRAIVGFTLIIDRLKSQWKMNQNKIGSERHGVKTGLAEVGALAISDLMT